MVGKQCKELWVELPDGQLMCALLNGDLGWLMHCDRTGDASCHSIAPDFSGPADRQIAYRLNNGQWDSYPAAWALPSSDIYMALDYFEHERQRAPFIEWSDD